MIEYYITGKENGLKILTDAHAVKDGVWINAEAPTEEELASVSYSTGFPLDILKPALDEDERPRAAFEDGNLLVIIDVPEISASGSEKIYGTIPLGILMNDKYILTISLRPVAVINDFKSGKTVCNTFKRTRFLLQMLYKNSQYYLKYLREIEKKSDSIENSLHKSMKNVEILDLLNLEHSLVYFSTSLKANESVLEKIMKSTRLKMYEDDTDLLDDVIIENKQAIEMATIYTNILGSTLDVFASIINNNMNRIIKILASVTIIISIPTLLTSFFGMNVPLPFQNNPTLTLIIIVAISAVVCFLTLIMWKKEYI